MHRFLLVALLPVIGCAPMDPYAQLGQAQRVAHADPERAERMVSEAIETLEARAAEADL